MNTRGAENTLAHSVSSQARAIEHLFDPARSFVIAEVAQAHEGSLGMAHAYVDAIAAAGAHAVKFQTHIADAESSVHESWRVNFSYEDATRQDYWRRMEFTPEQWAGLRQHAEDKGLLFLSSPFSVQAVKLLDRLGMAVWKVASGEVGNLLLLEHMLRTGKPMLLSSGMSGWEELDAAVGKIRTQGIDWALMQCTTAYPCPLEKVSLSVLSEFQERYGCPVGLSDHSARIEPCLAASMRGAGIFEVHVTMSREMFGPDVVASLTTCELKALVGSLEAFDILKSGGADKDEGASRCGELREMFGQSLVAARDMKAGEVVEFEDLESRKPMRGIPAGAYAGYTGKALCRDVAAGVFFQQGDFSSS